MYDIIKAFQWQIISWPVNFYKNLLTPTRKTYKLQEFFKLQQMLGFQDQVEVQAPTTKEGKGLLERFKDKAGIFAQDPFWIIG